MSLKRNCVTGRRHFVILTQFERKFGAVLGGENMPELTDLAAIRDLCARHSFTLSKNFGQNFIINPGVCPRMAEAAGFDADWGVLEIGPGIGVLTEQLARRAKKVVAVEVDQRLLPLLDETLASFSNVKIVTGDVLKIDLAALLDREFGGMPVAVCANLPYYITSPILMRLLGEKLPIRSITVLVQREVAQRICAAPGTREAGAISCAVSYYAVPKLLFTVQPGSFYPAPKVTSAVLRLEMRAEPAVRVPGGDEAAFFRLVRAAFGQRRKTVANAVASGLNLPKPEVLQALAKAELDARMRPEQFTLQNFCALQTALTD
jgi:16S rRNA (adenine1518-N6/adenine1519-N6)-dimethyltransferase